MRIAFLISSIGDTDLAKAAITKLIEKSPSDTLFVIPLTETALTRTKDLSGNLLINRISIDQLTNQNGSLSSNKLQTDELEKITDFLQQNNIQRIFVGVPSSDNEKPFQIAENINIPCTIAYEYMFRPTNHVLWNHIDKLVDNKNCEFAVSLPLAKEDILKTCHHHELPHVYEIGHLSIDRSQEPNTIDATSVRKALLVNSEELIFISGTTQPTSVDNLFLEEILKEISTNHYSNVQLRMGLHPGVENPDLYLQTLLNTCEKYPNAKDQFKIMLTSDFEKKLKQPILATSFILRCEVSGAAAAQTADKNAQAVPGALLNQSALDNKQSIHNQSTRSYLPTNWFSENFSAFFQGKQGAPHTKKELGLDDTAPNLLIKGMTK